MGVGKLIFASSIAVYGEGITGEVITDDTLQRPASIYGAGKSSVSCKDVFMPAASAWTSAGCGCLRWWARARGWPT